MIVFFDVRHVVGLLSLSKNLKNVQNVKHL